MSTEHENAVSLLEHHFKRLRYLGAHPEGCNSRKPQPFIAGCDVAFDMPCDCILSNEDPTHEEKVKYVRFMARHKALHDGACAIYVPLWDTYRGKRVNVVRNCTCWLSKLDKPAPKPYTESMTQFLILPLDREPAFFDTERTYPTERAAIKMLIYQGYDDNWESSGYWGHDYRIVSKSEYEAETKEPNPAQPVLDAIKAQVDQIRAKALGPHLDTPIYDQLAREYDEKYRTTTYFDSALAKKLERMGKYSR